MDPGANPSSAEAAQAAGDPTSSVVSKLLRDSTEYARALGQLVASETELAKVNLVRIAIVALLVPAIAAGAVLALNAWLAVLLSEWVNSWALAIGGVALIDVAALAFSMWLLRGWWRTLSLPRSRAALSGLWEKP
jgi:uncharacterized membrane protein YqjE